MHALKTLLLGTIVVVFATASTAEARNVATDKAPARAEETSRTLTAKEIQRTVMPTLPGLRTCYKKHALRYKKATGDVKFQLLITKAGKVREHKTIAPGVRGKKFTKCVDAVVASWDFPAKKGFTRAAVPFKFLKTHAKGAGPRR